VAIKTTF